MSEAARARNVSSARTRPRILCHAEFWNPRAMPAASPALGATDQSAVAIEHHDLERAPAIQLLEGDAARLPGDIVGKGQADPLGQEQHFVGRGGSPRMVEQVAGR